MKIDKTEFNGIPSYRDSLDGAGLSLWNSDIAPLVKGCPEMASNYGGTGVFPSAMAPQNAYVVRPILDVINDQNNTVTDFSMTVKIISPDGAVMDEFKVTAQVGGTVSSMRSKRFDEAGEQLGEKVGKYLAARKKK